MDFLSDSVSQCAWQEIVLSFAFALGKIAEYVPENDPIFVYLRIEV